MTIGNRISPPVACATTEQLVAEFDGSITFRGERAVIESALPSRASPELLDFLRPYASVAIERPFAARLPGGRVFGSGIVLSPDGKLIARDVSSDFGKAFGEHWLLTYHKISPPTRVAGRTAVIATTLGSGYSHWLLEELPRLLALKPDDAESLIAHEAGPFFRDALALHGFAGRIVAARRDHHFSCDELAIPSLGCLAPSTLQLLGEFTAPLRKASSALGEKLFISREKAKRRRLTNEPELWDALEKRGFVKLRLEELTWSEQISAFRAAKVIVAPHGAGLANLVFCNSGTQVVELFHRSYVNGCYWQLAALKALDYCPVVPLSSDPLAQLLHANRLDINCDVAQVLKALDR